MVLIMFHTNFRQIGFGLNHASHTNLLSPIINTMKTTRRKNGCWYVMCLSTQLQRNSVKS